MEKNNVIELNINPEVVALQSVTDIKAQAIKKHNCSIYLHYVL